MKKAAVVVDRWKLPIFTHYLKKANYDYEEVGELTADTLTLIVQVPDGQAQRLAQVILAANTEAARTKGK